MGPIEGLAVLMGAFALAGAMMLATFVIGVVATVALCVVFVQYAVQPALRQAKAGFFERPELVRAAAASFAVFAAAMPLSPILLTFEAPAVLCMLVTMAGTVAGIAAGFAFLVFTSYLQRERIAKANLAIAASMSVVLAAVLGGSMTFLWALALAVA